MKKLLSILLVCALLCGCSGQNASDTTTTPTTTASTTTTTVTTVVTPDTTSSTTTSYVPTPWPPPRETIVSSSYWESFWQSVDALPDSYEDMGLLYFDEHDHPDADPSNKELMELGESKFEDAKIIFSLMVGDVPVNEEISYPHGHSEIYAIDEEFGDYDSLVKLCSDTFHENLEGWMSQYYSVDVPEETSEKDNFNDIYHDEFTDGTIHERVTKAIVEHDGVTYAIQGTYTRGYPLLETKIVGVLRASDDCIVYRLCSMSDYSYAVEDADAKIYNDSIMKLELIDGEWLITQIKSGLIR